MKQLSKVNSHQCLLVIDGDGRFVDLLTDGDIRRGLLEHEDYNLAVSEICDFASISVDRFLSQHELKSLLRVHEIEHLPVVDDDGKIIGLYTQTNIIIGHHRILETPVVIMAGGRGKRLYPLTKNCPKPMLKIGDRPALEIIIEHAITAGFRKFFISVNFLKEQIIEYFGDGKNLGVEIAYLIEDQPLGTAGSLSLLPKDLRSDRLLVINGDVIFDGELASMVTDPTNENADVVVGYTEHTTHIPFGVLTLSGRHVSSLVEKPTVLHPVNAGFYCLSRRVLRSIEPNKPKDITEVILESLEKKLDVVGHKLEGSWTDIGRFETLEKARELT